MELTRKKRGIPAHTVGAAGITVAACAACCISLPLLGPVLAWLGITSLGAIASGWYVAAASVFAAGVAAGVFVRWRRRSAPLSTQRDSTCGCGTSCKI